MDVLTTIEDQAEGGTDGTVREVSVTVEAGEPFLSISSGNMIPPLASCCKFPFTALRASALVV